MNNLFLKPITLMAASALFVFSACSDEEVAPDAMLSAQNTEDSRSANSLKQNKMYTAELMPLNNSGVSGTAMLMLEGDMLTVHIEATGLEENAPHPQHIHGFVENNKNSICPPMSADMNGDGLIDLAESVPYYGPILLSLEPLQSAPDGTLSYTRTFDITEHTDLLSLQNDVIVLHGLTVNGSYVPTLPVACGQIKPMNHGK